LNSRQKTRQIAQCTSACEHPSAEQALRQIDGALAIDPLARTLKVQFLFQAGRHAEARRQLDATLQNSAGFWIA